MRSAHFAVRLAKLWLEALRLDGLLSPSRDSASRLAAMALFALRGRRVPPKVWRTRLRACQRCQIYHKLTRRCRKGSLGCGCSCPVKYLFEFPPGKSPCWAHEHGLADPANRVGWPSPNWPDK